MRPRRRDAAPLQPQARPSCRLQVDAVAAPVAALERRAAVRGSAQQKSDAYRCPRCVRDAKGPGSLIAPVQGARVSQRVFSLRDVITSASLRTRRGDTLVSLCESRFPLPRAMPAVCQLAACDAGLRRGDVGARLKYSLPRARVRRRRQIYRSRWRTERCAATRPLSRR